jgi:hypothetical protein
MIVFAIRFEPQEGSPFLLHGKRPFHAERLQRKRALFFAHLLVNE